MRRPTDTTPSLGPSEDPGDTDGDRDTAPSDSGGPTDSGSTPTDSATTPPPALVSLEVLHRPKMELSKGIAVVTSVPVSVRGRCTATGEPGEVHLVDDPTLLEARELELSGLLAEHEYGCALRFAPEHGPPLEVAVTVPVGSVPADLPVVRASSAPGRVAWGHYTVVNHWSDDAVRRVVVLDLEGRVRWYWSTEPHSVGIEGVLPFSRHLLVGGGRGLVPTLLDERAQPVWIGDAPQSGGVHHHDVSYHAGRGEILALATTAVTDGEGDWEGFLIEGTSLATGDVAWSFSSQVLVDAGVLPGPEGGGDDPWHTNAVSWVRDGYGEGLVVTVPRLDRILRVDPFSGEVHWQLGAGLGWALRDRSGRDLPSSDWFYFPHAPEYDGARMLIHDNGRGRPGGNSTRAMELTLDPAAKVAVLTWEYTELDWFSRFWGDVDRLPGGTILVAAGKDASNYDTPDVRRTWVREIDPDTNEVVHELWFEGVSDAIYRAERVSGCDLFRNLSACPELEP